MTEPIKNTPKSNLLTELLNGRVPMPPQKFAKWYTVTTILFIIAIAAWEWMSQTYGKNPQGTPGIYMGILAIAGAILEIAGLIITLNRMRTAKTTTPLILLYLLPNLSKALTGSYLNPLYLPSFLVGRILFPLYLYNPKTDTKNLLPLKKALTQTGLMGIKWRFPADHFKKDLTLLEAQGDNSAYTRKNDKLTYPSLSETDPLLKLEQIIYTFNTQCGFYTLTATSKGRHNYLDLKSRLTIEFPEINDKLGDQIKWEYQGAEITLAYDPESTQTTLTITNIAIRTNLLGQN